MPATGSVAVRKRQERSVDDAAIRMDDPRLTPQMRTVLGVMSLQKMRYLSRGKGQKYQAICAARLAIWHVVIGVDAGVLLEDTMPAPLDIRLP